MVDIRRCDCFGEEIPVNWKSIGISFDDFFEKLIEGRGYRWYL